MDQSTYSRRLFFLLFLGIVVYLVREFLVPVAMGAVFATVLDPAMRWFHRSKVSLNQRAMIITSLFMLVILLPAGLLFAVGASRALGVIEFLQGKLQNPTDGASAPSFFETIGLSRSVVWINQWVPVTEQQLRDVFLKGARSAGVIATDVLTGFLSNLPGFLVTCFVIVVALFFFLRDGRKCLAFIRRNSVFSAGDTTSILRAAAALCKSSVYASIVTGGAQALVITFSGLICGLTFSALTLVGLTAFLSSFVPLIGTAPLMLGLSAYGFIVGPSWHGLVFVLFMGVSGLTDNLVRPLVLGGGGGDLHPLVAFVSAFAGLAALGFYGLFIGPVIVGLFFVLLSLHDARTLAINESLNLEERSSQ